ncbi:DUF4232 domain-containing protein [Streptomyces sp.]|uniref:DUF4232 domain-containing protein n=1 Tax=Streptomyces sp. TaxID=1931 RepID=UPI002F429214
MPSSAASSRARIRARIRVRTRVRDGVRDRGVVTGAALVVVSALVLSACGTSSSSSSSSSHGGSGSRKSKSSHSGSVGKSKGTAEKGAKPYVVTSRTPPHVPRCHTRDLAVSFETGGAAAPDVTSDQQQTAGVAVRNSSGHACVVGGFPGVDLRSGTTRWSLSRASQEYDRITLRPGGTTDFPITFLPEPKGSWTPSTVTVTPPDETTSKTLRWPWGPVLLQDGATHPGTYVGPIG